MREITLQEARECLRLHRRDHKPRKGWVYFLAAYDTVLLRINRTKWEELPNHAQKKIMDAFDKESNMALLYGVKGIQISTYKDGKFRTITFRPHCLSIWSLWKPDYEQG